MGPGREREGPTWRARGVGMALGAILLLVAGADLRPAQAQSPSDREAYVRVMTVHFELPAGEAERLMEAPMAAHELPVILFLARESGIAETALTAMRRGGSSWMALSRRAGVGVDRWHVEIPEGLDDPRVRRLQELFASTPRSNWGSLEFTDDEIVTLVHLKVFTRRFQTSVDRVLAVRGGVGSWIEVPARLVGED